jgi:hypothetical protein
MSSWVVAKSKHNIKKEVSVKSFHNTESSSDISALYLETLAAYIYNQKLGETCVIFDGTSILSNTLKFHPQVKLLKEIPADSECTTVSTYKPTVSGLKFKDVQKYAWNLFQFTNEFHHSLNNTIEREGIKGQFNIGIHLSSDVSGSNLPEFKRYIDTLRSFQKNSKLERLSVYVMANSPSLIREFQPFCDPSWKITSLSKTGYTNSVNQRFVNLMADVSIMTKIPAVVLDFKRPSDRLIYLMQANKDGFEYMNEINSSEWYFI